MSSFGKDSATLEREVEEQRRRVESRIGEIRERLSPGQLVDELLSYTKNGGQHFASNLAGTVTNNPLPAALLGISLVWLMSGQGPRLPMSHREEEANWGDEPEYPYATVSGRMRRVGHSADDTGSWFSQFEDTSGRRYKAESNELGHRLGAFVDETGRKFGGFIDDAGHRVRDFTDEAGNRLDEAGGWASHRWRDVQRGVGAAVDKAAHHAQKLGGTTQHQFDRASHAMVSGFNSQPLVAGALAFAAGAALGAALPHTAEEDRILGKVSDKTLREAAGAASELYEEGKERAADLYEKGKEGATRLYEDLQERPEGSRDLH